MVEAGKVDLDAPVCSYVDPWLTAQGFPKLEILFNATGSNISVVTVKEPV
jgi:CubicO group peptidase (beta-lactamase class C family)